MVMAQSLFKLLHQRDPEISIDVLAPAWSEPLLARMPEVRRSVTMPLGHGELGISKRIAIGRALRAERYDRAIVLPRSLKQEVHPIKCSVAVESHPHIEPCDYESNPPHQAPR